MAALDVMLFPIALYLTIACLTSIPFYIYGLSKWYQFKHHFMVTKRFPIVSNMIVIVSLITMINEMIRRWLDYINGSPMRDHHGLMVFRSIASANSFLICSLPVYRLLLIYLRWKKTQSAITKILKDTRSNSLPPTKPRNNSALSPSSLSATATSPGSTSIPATSPVTVTTTATLTFVDNLSARSDSVIFSHYPNMTSENVSQPITSIVLALFMFIGYFAILIRQIAAIPTLIIGMIWTCAIICSVCLITLVKVEKVHEGIGCLREAYTIILCLIINLLAQVISMVDHSLIFDRYIVQYISASFVAWFGLLPIYIALYYIKQSEGSLDVHRWTDKFKEEMYRNRNSIISRTSLATSAIPVPPASRTSSLRTDTVSGLSIVIAPNGTTSAAVDEQNEEKKYRKVNSVVAALDMKCLDFLKEETNYKAFAAYLSHCFALENLLFMEKVNILFAIVKKLKVTGGNTQNDEEPHREMKRNKFKYLSSTYEEYQRKLNKWSTKYNRKTNVEIGCVDYYKKALYKIYHSIYTTYIESDAEQQVNLSDEIRTELSEIFEDENALLRFNSFHDFMHVFDDALVEIYRLVFGIYSYRFKKWCIAQHE